MRWPWVKERRRLERAQREQRDARGRDEKINRVADKLEHRRNENFAELFRVLGGDPS